MKSGDIVKIIKVAYPFIKEDAIGKISKLLINENGKYYLEDLKVYAAEEILTTDLDYQIDKNNYSIVIKRKNTKLVTIDDSIKNFIKKVEDGSELEFETYVRLYSNRLLELVKNKNHPKWVEALYILNENR